AATEIPAENFCTACFTSNYPIPVAIDQLRSKHVLETPLADIPASTDLPLS
ncbi:MAG: hypothetical protein QOK47_1080, partial [Actinomycetota bacterium]|nr:hypothetical protein [Actinomycetota bacterium]